MSTSTTAGIDKVLKNAEPDTTVRSAGIRKGTSSFTGGVLALSGGVAIAHLLTILAAPITSRIFAPEAFGFAELFTSFVGIFSIVSCLRYESSVMLPEKDSDAANLFVLCCVFITTSSLLMLGIVACFGRKLLGALHRPEFVPYMWFLPLGVLVSSLVLPLRYWNSRHRRFKQLSIINITSVTSGVVTSIAVGLAGYISGGHLFVAKLSLPLCAAVMMAWYVFHHDLFFMLRHCKTRDMWRMGKRYIKFPLFGIWSVLFNSAALSMPVILLATCFGMAEAGFYGRSMALLQLPIVLLGQAISQVFFQRASAERARGESISDLVEGVYRRTMAIIILPLLIVVLIGRDIFVVVLGAQWEEAGVYAAILVPWMLASCQLVCMTDLYDIFELQNKEMLFNILLLSTMVGSMVLGSIFLKDVKPTLLLLSIAVALTYVFRSWYILSATGLSFPRVVLSMSRYFIVAVPVLMIIAIARWWMKLPSTWLLLIAILTSIPYYVYLLRQDRYMRQFLSQIARSVVQRGWFSKLRLFS